MIKGLTKIIKWLYRVFCVSILAYFSTDSPTEYAPYICMSFKRFNVLFWVSYLTRQEIRLKIAIGIAPLKESISSSGIYEFQEYMSFTKPGNIPWEISTSAKFYHWSFLDFKAYSNLLP